MKIAYIITNIRSCGPYRILDTMISNCGNREIVVISLFGKDDPKLIQQLQEKNVKVVDLGLNPFLYFLTGYRELKKILQKWKIDIAHSHGILPDCLLSKISFIKKITTLHNNMYEDYVDSFGKIQSIFYIWWHKRNLKKFNSVVCCSKSIYDYFSHKYSCSNLTYIRNGIDPINYCEEDIVRIRKEIRNRYSIPETATLCFYAGGFNKRKGTSKLMDYFSSLSERNIYLLAVGNGNTFLECKSKSTPKTLLLGYQTDIFPYLIASDVYVSNSSSEGFSISILEALMLHKTLFLSNIPSHAEVIEYLDEYCGMIFESTTFCNDILQVQKHLHYTKETLYLISSERMMDEYEKLYERL